MKKFLVMMGTLAGSLVGWYIGAKVSFMTGYFFSVIGAGAGLYVSKRVIRNYLG